MLADRPDQAPDGGVRSRREVLEAADLHAELDRFKDELRAGGLRESTVHAYLLGSRLFVRWLGGEYAPGPGRAERT